MVRLCEERTSSIAHIEELRLHEATFYDLAEHFSTWPDFVLLDSRTHDGGQGRFSFFSFSPFARLMSKGDRITLRMGGREQISYGSPFQVLAATLDRYRTEWSGSGISLPFLGGGIGYFSYELGRQIERLPGRASDELGLPDCYLCFYNFAIFLSHEEGETFLCHFEPESPPFGVSKELILREVDKVEPGVYGRCGPLPVAFTAEDGDGFAADFTPDSYVEAIRHVKDLIFAGDAYQVNLTQRFHAELDGASPWHLYKCLMEVNPAPFAAYLSFENHVVVSSSPERFLRLEGRKVETRPIKGTVRRASALEEDAKNRHWLWNSGKNRAELAMIVDLLRNDLGRVCTPGSIHVGAFPELESYASVHHLVATITGELAEGATVVDLLEATFPGGSITGMPKIRAMEIIDELEPVTRGVYTGSIGYLSFHGIADLNIAIRTMIVKDGVVYIQAGGGIVADSDEVEEYEESLLKAKKLFQAVRWVREAVGGPSCDVISGFRC